MLPIVPISSVIDAANYVAYVMIAWSLAVFVGIHGVPALSRPRQEHDDTDA
jgi:ABC-type branched-subunit amino acid transport system permease subunit